MMWSGRTQPVGAVVVLAFLLGALPLAAQPASEASPPSDRPNIIDLLHRPYGQAEAGAPDEIRRPPAVRYPDRRG